jgi:hypothetical protein
LPGKFGGDAAALVLTGAWEDLDQLRLIPELPECYPNSMRLGYGDRDHYQHRSIVTNISYHFCTNWKRMILFPLTFSLSGSKSREPSLGMLLENKNPGRIFCFWRSVIQAAAFYATIYQIIEEIIS